MAPDIKKGQWWEDRSTKIPHMVVGRDKDEVVTWSAPSQVGGGHSWIGDTKSFLNQFIPSPPTKKLII